MGMNITPELKQQLSILSHLDEEYRIGEFLIAMFEYSEGLHPDPEDMHPVVASMFRYWIEPTKYRELFPS